MTTSVLAQQFIGLSADRYTGIQQMPYNPAWVNTAATGMEISFISFNALAGTNAFVFSKPYTSNGFAAGAKEGQDYFKDSRNGNKNIWGNMELSGPSVSFKYKENQHIGVYTRMRQITRAGSITRDMLGIIGDEDTSFPKTLSFDQAGFSTHTFAEIGFTFGKTLMNDEFQTLRAGVTVKYLMGLAAGSIYTTAMNVERHTSDSMNKLEGDLTVLYTDNISPYIDNDFSNDMGSWFNRSGKGSLGFDMGIQYEYYPDGDPNRPTPYSFMIAASITDIGSIGYKADSGSGVYNISVRNKADWQLDRQPYEPYATYFRRLERDTVLSQAEGETTTFRMGLPTAFRLQTDINLNSGFWLQANILLNMRGNNGSAYKSAYVNMVNITPRYEHGMFMFGLPFTYIGFQTMTLGAVFRAGPLFIGSSSIISAAITSQTRNLDAYIGLAWKFNEKQLFYR